MSQYHRLKTEGACYFFTVVSYHRRPILCCDSIRKALHDAIKITQQQMPFTIDAWVLMPDHIHCIWTLPPMDANYSKRWSMIKRHVSQTCPQFTNKDNLSQSQKKRKEFSIWQRRFWEHQIRDQTDFNHHMDYLHYNPTKHGLCQQPNQWQWSTLHRYVKQGKYAANWGGSVDLIAGVNESGLGE